MPLFNSEHWRLLEIYHPEGYRQYTEVLASLGSYMEKKILPLSPKFDTGEESIVSPRRELLEQGFCQIPFPSQFGGLGLPFSIYANAVELLGAADASIALSLEIHNAVSEAILNFGNEEQKKKLLPDLISGKKLASFALTEPASGSDSGNMSTKARKTPGGYSISGSKTFITNAGEADVYLVFAAGRRGHSAFLVDSDTKGMKFGEDLRKLGMRGSRTSEITFSDCKVPESDLLGEEGKGHDYAKHVLHGARIVVAALNVGITQLAYEKTLSYSRQRKAFGQPISDFQLTREKIADIKTSISAGRLLYYHAARLKEMGTDYSSEAAQAKVFATEMSVRACDAAIQVFGGYGYTSDDIHRHYRDARLLTIGEGTSEVLRLLIAKRELAKSA